ncbi:hypothetical protein [Kribbella sp. CA-294648]|uniref:hypothetical protein n=1 Tax=Kribbella sp. CA-294648 TaxID=3239948 RepID=UPI003D8E503E
MTDHHSTPGPSVLQRIWRGMLVIDRDGALIGSVESVRQDHPSAPGFLTVTRVGQPEHSRYVAANQIAYADEGVVRLFAKADELLLEFPP